MRHDSYNGGIPGPPPRIPASIKALGCVFLLLWLMFWAGIIYIAAHFIIKHW